MAWNPSRKWTREEVVYLDHAQHTRTAREIAKALHRTPKGVTAKIERMRHGYYRKLLACGYTREQARHAVEGYVYEG